MLQAIIEAVRECGPVLLSARDVRTSVSTKEGRANFVTRYDTAVQARLKESLLKIVPEAVFVGEEGEHEQYAGAKWTFIVDPIDGTTNFIRNYHKSCISVGLACDGHMEIGVIFNPYSDEMFYAKRGEGAFLNGERIHVSELPLSEGLVCFGTSPYDATLIDRTFELAKTLHKASLDVRRSGSAALDLCDIASGRCELFFECKLSPWDFAAGSLLVEEAGGIISTMDKEKLDFENGCSILAGGSTAYADYWQL